MNLSKTFGTRNCSLCLQEKLKIVRISRKSTGREFLNRRSKIECECKHRTNFYRMWVRGDTIVATDECTCLPVSISIHKKFSKVKTNTDKCLYLLNARKRNSRA